MSTRHRHFVALLVVLGLALAACGGATAEDADPGSRSTGAAGDGPTVVATTAILGDVVGRVVGDDGTVEVLMGPGVDPHAFQASARQARSLREADLVVANGLQLEESLLDALDAAEADGAVVLRIAEDLDPLPYGDEDGEEDGHDEHEGEEDGAHADESEHAEDADESKHDDGHGAFDPHVWLDPRRMARGVEMIATELAAVDPGQDDEPWAQRASAYVDELTALDGELQEILAVVPEDDRKLVTNHDAFEYFADRYDFEVVGTVIPGATTQAEPSAQEFAALAEVVVEEDVPAIFSETSASDQVASTLAQEVGRDVQIVELYSGTLGEDGSGVETYVDLLRFDAEAIASALG